MPRNDGHITRKKILDAAEKLFSNFGFHASSMSMLAKESGIQKASIYYHFKDKDEILSQLFMEMIKDFNESSKEQKKFNSVEEKMRFEIEYLYDKKHILNILLMESLKDGGGFSRLIKIANHSIEHEGKGIPKHDNFIFEFFTGFLPLINFVVYLDKSIIELSISREEMIERFIATFKLTHLSNH